MIAFITVAAYPLVSEKLEVKEYITLQVNLRQSLPPKIFTISSILFPEKKILFMFKVKAGNYSFFVVSLPLFFSYNLENFDCISFAPFA